MNWHPKINKRSWYIVNIEDISKPWVYLDQFPLKAQATITVDRQLNMDYTKYRVVQGAEIVSKQIPYKKYWSPRWKSFKPRSVRFRKYDYPAWAVTSRERANYRKAIGNIRGGWCKTTNYKLENLEILKLFNENKVNQYEKRIKSSKKKGPRKDNKKRK